MGMLTLDQVGSLGTAVSFVNIDGVPMSDPTTINQGTVQSGQYELWSETYYNISNALVNGGGNVAALATAFQTAIQTSTPGPGVFNVQGLGNSRPMHVTRGGNLCSPPEY